MYSSKQMNSMEFLMRIHKNFCIGEDLRESVGLSKDTCIFFHCVHLTSMPSTNSCLRSRHSHLSTRKRRMFEFFFF